MAAITAGVVAKKALEVLASSEKGRKFLGYTVGIILVIVLLPLIALTGLFGFLSSKEFPIDAQNIIAQLPAEDRTAIEQIDTTGSQILTVFTQSGLTDADMKKAQAIYIACLIGKESGNFVTDLADCFINITGESDSVYDNIESKFHVTFAEEHRKYFNENFGITCKNTIDTSGFTNLKTKNVHDLIEWAKVAYAQKWGYVYGTYGIVLTQPLLDLKAEQHSNEVGKNIDYISENWLGRRTADSVGLIKGYCWFNAETGAIEAGSGGMPDIGADTMYATATEKGTIDAMSETPGLAVWQEGHIGIYIGKGYVIQAANTQAGVIKTKLDDGGWTHWLKIPYVKYE